MNLDIEVISDLICPWCYLGKHRLERALELLGPEYAARITWRAFELNPGMPAGGMDRKAYRTAKFGNWERSLELDARIAQLGTAEGAPFDHARMQRTPNTLAAHRLVWLARGEGVQDAVVGGLFRAYFTEGRDIGDRETLLEIAEAAGLPRDRVGDFLDSDLGVAEIREEERTAAELDVTSVPTFRVNGRTVITGAQPAEQLVAALREIAAEKTYEPV